MLWDAGEQRLKQKSFLVFASGTEPFSNSLGNRIEEGSKGEG